MIPVNIPLVTVDDIRSVEEVLQNGWISGEGPIVRNFEEVVAESVGRKFGVAVSNGSDALELALEVLEIDEGDEVIIPSFAIISCLAPVLRKGAVPVFVDVHPKTWNVTAELIENAVTRRTKAILVIHTYGMSVEMDPILKLASKHNLRVIEDSAEAQGLTYKDRPCGSMGDVSTFSFYANKNVTTGEGGMVLTDDPRLDERLRELRNLAFLPERRFVHRRLGWNMRLSSLQAAIGISQLKRLDQSVARRREIAGAYLEALAGVEGLGFQATHDAGCVNGYWVVGLTLEKHPKFESAVDAMRALEKAGVGTRPFFFPLHRQPLLREVSAWRTQGTLEVSEFLGEMGFYVPNGLGMSDVDLEKAVKLTLKVLGS